MLCRAGTFQPGAAQSLSSACTSCGAGKYSTGQGLGSSAGCLLCGNGTYSAAVDLNTSAGCLACPGNASSPQGSGASTSCVCNAGFSGANGAACSICGASTWCASGTPNSCPHYSQALQPGAGQITDCYCNAGYYGYALIVGTPCAFCPANYYCPGGAVNYSVLCPNGQLSYGNSSSLSACFCPPNAETGPGAFNPGACTCRAGYKKVQNASSPLFGWSCELCPSGEICIGGVNC